MKAVNSNSQTMLAKLLAKENINVVVGNYDTAFFDVKSRTLGLPTWNSTNKGVSDLLVGHEVGHALYTPSDAIEKFRKLIPGAPFDIANIVEDIRIERLVRANYPGLIYSFNEGYKYFVENDFFKIKNLVTGNLKFIDRLNLRGKIGALVKVPMNKDEEAIYSRCLAAETYDEVLIICKDIYDLIKNEKEQEKQESESGEQEKSQEQTPSSADSSDGDSEDSEDSDDSEDSKNDQPDKGSDDSKDEESKDGFKSKNKSEDPASEEEEEQSGKDTRPAPTEEEDDSDSKEFEDQLNSKQLDAMQSTTQNQFDSNLKSLQKEMDYHVVNSPTKEQTMNCVVGINEIMTARKSHPLYNAVMNNQEFVNDFVQFKSNTKKHIAVLIKEFERRKSAFQYSRSRESDSGSINVNKLHSYKFEDQIFKSVTTLADAKSHGMVFFIDYSGSMRYSLEDVVDQTLQLVYFCKAVGIPFEVYGFTGPEYLKQESIPKTFGMHISLDSRAHVFELLNSTMKKDKFELSVRELKAQLFKFNKNGMGMGKFNMDTIYETMCSTPLIETIIIAHDIVKNFKQKHRIQKMNTIFLTDGDGAKPQIADVTTDVEYRKPMDPKNRSGHKNYKVKIHGREIEFKQNGYYYSSPMSKQLYLDLIENLKITCGSTAVGFFIGQNQKDIKTTGTDACRYNAKNKGKEEMTWSQGMEMFKAEIKKNKKQKCILITGAFGYDAYFIFEGSKNLNIDNDESFESESLKEGKSFSESSAQNKLAKDFTKFTSEKRNSRVFLSKFAEIIA